MEIATGKMNCEYRKFCNILIKWTMENELTTYTQRIFSHIARRIL